MVTPSDPGYLLVPWVWHPAMVRRQVMLNVLLWQMTKIKHPVKWNVTQCLQYSRERYNHLNAIKCTESLVLLWEGAADTELQALHGWLFSVEMGYELVLIWNWLSGSAWTFKVVVPNLLSLWNQWQKRCGVRIPWHVLGCTNWRSHTTGGVTVLEMTSPMAFFSWVICIGPTLMP